jgi:hypothetical protein
VSDNEPIAWAVMLPDGDRIYDVYAIEEEAKAIDEFVTGNHGIVPLYRSPTLTDAERFVLREVMDIYAGEDDVASNEIAAVIDGLLERTR